MSTEKRLAQIARSLSAIERGKWSELSLERCADLVSWMARFRKVPQSVTNDLSDRIARIFESGEYCPEYLK